MDCFFKGGEGHFDGPSLICNYNTFQKFEVDKICQYIYIYI